MNEKQLKYILEELHFTAELPPEVLNSLAEHSSLKQISAGEVVFREGMNNHNLFLVRNGRFVLEMNVPGRGGVQILTLGPGEMLGWSALIHQGKMTASAVALENAELVVIPSEKLQAICETNHKFGYHLMRQMADALSKRLIATRLQLLDLFVDIPSAFPVKNSEG